MTRQMLSSREVVNISPASSLGACLCARLEGWPRVPAFHPSFETLASQAPQDEVSARHEERPLSRVSKDRNSLRPRGFETAQERLLTMRVGDFNSLRENRASRFQRRYGAGCRERSRHESKNSERRIDRGTAGPSASWSCWGRREN